MDTTPRKRKILSILKVPPPVTGATLSNTRFIESKRINEQFQIKHITISYARNISDLGRLSLLKFMRFAALTFRVISSILFYKPDFIYFQISPKSNAFKRDFLLVLIIKLFHKRIVFHIRGIGINTVASKSRVLKKMYQVAFKKNYLICFSELVSQDITLVYKRVPFIVPNGLTPSITEKDLLKRSNDDMKTVNLLFISNFLEAKGVFDIIESARLLKSFNYRLNMIGSVSGNDVIIKMKAQIKKYQLENYITIVGERYGSEKQKFLLDADIFVFPTHNEGFGNVALEAMESSLPVVAYSEGSLPYIIDDGVSGFLVPKGDINKLTQRLKLLINDRKLRDQMGSAGRSRFIEHFTIDHFEKNMIKTFNSVLSEI